MDINPDPSNQPNFIKKPVEAPILNVQERAVLQPKPPTSNKSGGIKEFYNTNKFYFWAIFLGLAIIVVLAYFALFRKTPAAAPSGANVSVSIQAPASIPSGSDTIYKVIIENDDSQTLINQQLEIVYPDGVKYESATPNADNLSGTEFTIPDLIPGQNVAVLIKAQTSGNINDVLNLTASLHYHLSNFSSEFVKEQDFSIHIIASDITMQLTGPPTANNSDTQTYTLSYANNSQQDISNAKIQFVYPDGFTFASATPGPSLGTDTWAIDSLAQGVQGTIVIQGKFDTPAGESRTLTASFLVLGDGGDYFTQASSNITTSIAIEPLSVSQTLQNQSQSGVVNPGDTVSLVLTYQNNSDVAATGVNIVANLNSPAIDPTTIQAQGAQISGTTLLWNAASVPGLQSLNPNDTGTLLVTFTLKNPATRDASKNLSLASQIKINSNEYPNYFSGNELDLKISSPSAITAKVSYVSGPLPPRTNQTTVYTVTLSLSNATNDFSNAVVSAFIPLGPSGFDPNSVSVGERTNVSFDSSTGKLTWQVGALPAHTGQFTQARTLQFNVHLTPALADIGSSPVLIKTIVMDATDTYTNAAVHNPAADLSTQDAAGGSGYGDGTVTQ